MTSSSTANPENQLETSIQQSPGLEAPYSEPWDNQYPFGHSNQTPFGYGYPFFGPPFFGPPFFAPPFFGPPFFRPPFFRPPFFRPF